jgi:hypothetical protein
VDTREVNLFYELFPLSSKTHRTVTPFFHRLKNKGDSQVNQLRYSVIENVVLPTKAQMKNLFRRAQNITREVLDRFFYSISYTEGGFSVTTLKLQEWKPYLQRQFERGDKKRASHTRGHPKTEQSHWMRLHQNSAVR